MDNVWERLHSSRSWGKYPAIDLIQPVMRNFPSRQKREETRILELGCGTGANLKFFLNEGFQVIGIDGSDTAIANAKVNLETLKGKTQELDLHVSTFSDWVMDDCSLDLSIDYVSVCCTKFDEISETYKKIARFLRPGGNHLLKAYGRKTTGYGTGQFVEDGTWRNPTCGPCLGMGLVHFFNLQDLEFLFRDWHKVEIFNHLTTCPSKPEFQIEEWRVWATL